MHDEGIDIVESYIRASESRLDPNKFHDAFNLSLKHFDPALLEKTKRILDTLMKGTKAQWEKDLLKKIEISGYLPLSPLQVVLYRMP